MTEGNVADIAWGGVVMGEVVINGKMVGMLITVYDDNVNNEDKFYDGDK